MQYGREESEWVQLAKAGEEFLIKRAQLARPTSYTEFNTVLAQRTGLERFDFDLERDRAAMGYLLDRVNAINFPKSKLMISALVNYLDSNDPGPGFFTLAQKLRLLRSGASEQEKAEFWQDQLVAVVGRYRAG